MGRTRRVNREKSLEVTTFQAEAAAWSDALRSRRELGVSGELKEGPCGCKEGTKV